MLFTTFLLATAVVTAAVLAAMLLSRKKDARPTRISAGFAFVAIAALCLLALGWALV